MHFEGIKKPASLENYDPNDFSQDTKCCICGSFDQIGSSIFCVDCHCDFGFDPVYLKLTRLAVEQDESFYLKLKERQTNYVEVLSD